VVRLPVLIWTMFDKPGIAVGFSAFLTFEPRPS